MISSHNSSLTSQPTLQPTSQPSSQVPLLRLTSRVDSSRTSPLHSGVTSPTMRGSYQDSNLSARMERVAETITEQNHSPLEYRRDLYLAQAVRERFDAQRSFHNLNEEHIALRAGYTELNQRCIDLTQENETLNQKYNQLTQEQTDSSERINQLDLKASRYKKTTVVLGGVALAGLGFYAMKNQNEIKKGVDNFSFSEFQRSLMKSIKNPNFSFPELQKTLAEAITKIPEEISNLSKSILERGSKSISNS